MVKGKQLKFWVKVLNLLRETTTKMIISLVENVIAHIP